MEDNKQAVLDLERLFDIYDEIFSTCVRETEKETRTAIKEHIAKLLKEAKTPNERDIIIKAYDKFCSMDYEEILEMADPFADDEEEQEPFLREKIMNSKPGATFPLHLNDEIDGFFKFIYKFIYHDKIYCLLINLTGPDDEFNELEFYEFIFADTMEEDELIKVEDPDLNKELFDYYDSIKDGGNK